MTATDESNPPERDAEPSAAADITANKTPPTVGATSWQAADAPDESKPEHDSTSPAFDVDPEPDEPGGAPSAGGEDR